MTVQRDPEGNEAEILEQYVNFSGQRILEVGCGDGRLTWKYSRHARSIVGIDLEAQDLRVAKIDCPVDQWDITTFALADSIHLPFSRAAFDIAILAWSF